MLVYLLLLLPISTKSANLIVCNGIGKQIKFADDVENGVVKLILFHHNIKKILKEIEDIELIALSENETVDLRIGLNSVTKVLEEAKKISLNEAVQCNKRKEDLRGFKKFEPQIEINKNKRFKIISDRDYAYNKCKEKK